MPNSRSTLAAAAALGRWSLLAAVAFLAPGVAAAESFQPSEHGFVLQRGKEYIRFDKGTWTAGVQGGKSVHWQMFLWHDKWVYETLPKGRIEFGPTLHEDGHLSMKGRFSSQDGSAPMRYAYHIQPAADGVRVRCELEKSGPLKVTNGVWLRVSGDGKAIDGKERVWISPSWHGTLAAHGTGNADRLLVELDPPRSLCLGGLGYRQVEKEDSSQDYAYRVKLLSDDFQPGQKATVEYTIGWADMPATFPGQITPMRAALRIGKATATSSPIPQYGRLELAVDLDATYENPFDPDDVRLDAVFTSPSGKTYRVPGFFMVDYQRTLSEGREVMSPQGRGVWKVRFTPSEIGRYTWRLTLGDRSGETAGGEGSFQAVAAASPGFVRVSPADPHYLAFDSGRGFFPIGHNLPIYHTQGQLGDEAMRKFAAAKENYNRWWMSSSGFGIEWMDRLGWYRQDTAVRLDLTLDLAAQLGQYYMLCMDTHQDFRERGWLSNPFNARNGGPCQKPADWFTNETAKRYYKKRLRYTIARWGYSPHVLCWEFGNEFEGWADSPAEIRLAWHREMSDHLRALDPFGHLITTSFWSNTGPEDFWDLKNIDIVQTHCYTNDDGNVAEPVRRYSLHQWQRFQKPHLFGEFGIRSHASTAEKDPQGWAIHNALWAGLTNFCAGGVMPWWHEDYLDKLDLYFHFTSLANFTADLPLGTARWQPLATAPPELLDKNRTPEAGDVVVSTVNGWEKDQKSEFSIRDEEATTDALLPGRLLHGGGHRDLRNPPTFVVNYPRPGKFVVHVGKVSNAGLLQVWVDDRQRLATELPCDKGLGKESVWQAQWKIWETTYDADVAVAIPAGQHRIRVDNSGKDWVEVTRYTFTGCRLLDRPDVLVCGMKAGDLAVLWVQNKESTWHNHAAGTVRRVDGFALEAQGLRDGNYHIQWWETWKGALLRQEEARVRDGKLRLEFPGLKTDVAIKAKLVP